MLSGKPKYLTQRAGASPVVFDSGVRDDTETCVLVEDALSAVKVGRQRRAIALMGTTTPEAVLSRLVKEHDRFLVWLDMDNPQVRENAKKLWRSLSLHSPTKVVPYQGKDPKLMTDEEITQVLEKYHAD